MAKYKTFKVTAKSIEHLDPCSSGLGTLRRLFPGGVTISNSQEEMSEKLIKIASELSHDDAWDLWDVLVWFVYETTNDVPWRLTGDPSDVGNLAVFVSDSSLLK